MKKVLILLAFMGIFLSGCVKKQDTNTERIDLEKESNIETVSSNILKKGDEFSLTGIVEYSDEPSDIGLEYCFITISEKLEYYYIDVYEEESKWSSNVFYTKGEDTARLREYVGREVTVSGVFEAECHGIPYITDISIMYN